MRRGAAGMGSTELLVSVVVMGLLAGMAFGHGGRQRAALRLENALRRVALGLEMGRAAAERAGRPCALTLSERGWQEPAEGSLPACEGVALPLEEGAGGAAVQLRHNLPEAVRFSTNGLVLDGGTVRLAMEGTEAERCLVVSLPLGVTRRGVVVEGGCRPEPA